MSSVTRQKKGGKREKADPCALTLPMGEWLAQGDDTACRPCLLGILAQWYSSVLKERGRADLALEIQRVADKEDLKPAEVGRLFDTIKGQVPHDLQQRLREFDCTVQVNAETLGKEE